MGIINEQKAQCNILFKKILLSNITSQPVSSLSPLVPDLPNSLSLKSTPPSFSLKKKKKQFFQGYQLDML